MEEGALVDSNILIYTYAEDSAKKATAIKLLRQCFAGKNTLHIALQNVGEFCSVSIKKYKIDAAKVNAVAQALLRSEHFHKIHYKESTFSAAIKLAGNSGLQFWDAMLAATMLENSIDTIYTEDAGFGKVPGIKTVNPF